MFISVFVIYIDDNPSFANISSLKLKLNASNLFFQFKTACLILNEDSLGALNTIWFKE